MHGPSLLRISQSANYFNFEVNVPERQMPVKSSEELNFVKGC
jgi:hypothetical protein